MTRKPKVRIGKMLKEEGHQYHCLTPCGKCCNGGMEIPIHSYEKKRYKLGRYYSGEPKVIRLDERGNDSSTGELFYMMATKEDGTCWYLKNKLCSIYSKRPEVCRGYVCKRRYREAMKLRAEQER